MDHTSGYRPEAEAAATLKPVGNTTRELHELEEIICELLTEISRLHSTEAGSLESITADALGSPPPEPGPYIGTTDAAARDRPAGLAGRIFDQNTSIRSALEQLNFLKLRLIAVHQNLERAL